MSTWLFGIVDESVESLVRSNFVVPAMAKKFYQEHVKEVEDAGGRTFGSRRSICMQKRGRDEWCLVIVEAEVTPPSGWLTSISAMH